MCGLRGWAECGHVCRLEAVGKAIDQWCLWTDHNKADCLRLAKLHHIAVIANIQRHNLRFLGDARISGGGVELVASRGSREAKG